MSSSGVPFSVRADVCSLQQRKLKNLNQSELQCDKTGILGQIIFRSLWTIKGSLACASRMTLKQANDTFCVKKNCAILSAKLPLPHPQNYVLFK